MKKAEQISPGLLREPVKMSLYPNRDDIMKATGLTAEEFGFEKAIHDEPDQVPKWVKKLRFTCKCGARGTSEDMLIHERTKYHHCPNCLGIYSWSWD